MKKLYLIIIIVFSAGNIMAQTYCEKVFTSAEKLFNEGRYNQAKQKFEAVKKDCPNNRDIADVYIKLCTEKTNNIELNKKVDQFNELQDSLKKTKDLLYNCEEKLRRTKNENDNLMGVNTKLSTQNTNLREIQELACNDKEKLQESVQSEIAELKNLLDTIDRDLSKCENESFMKRVFKHKETEKTISSIREKIEEIKGIKPEEE